MKKEKMKKDNDLIRKKERLDRLKKRDELVIKRFDILSKKKYKDKKKLTNQAIIAMLSDEFPPLSENYIEKIVFGRVTYRSDEN